jgi:hypothetical protein
MFLRVALAALLPAAIVAARFIVPALSGHEIDLSWVFAMLGFVATFLGCLAAAVALRRRLAKLSPLRIAVVGAAVAAILLAIFPTLPGWPLSSGAIAVAWIGMAGTFTAALVYAASYRVSA